MVHEKAMARMSADPRFQAFVEDVRQKALAEFDGDGGPALREFGGAAAYGADREGFARLAVGEALRDLRRGVAAAPAAAAAAAAGPTADDRDREAARRAALMAAQATLVRARCAPGKPLLPCAAPDEAVDAGRSAALAAPGGGRRAVADGVATPAECAAVVRLALAGMRRRPRRGGKASLGVDSCPGSLCRSLVDRCAAACGTLLDLRCGLDVSGAMVTRIVAAPRPGDAFEGQRGYPYWNPHADELNNGSYEVSCLLYLNTRGVGFAGGDFAFLDVDADRLVAPRAGRLLAFTGGTDNFHQVRRVEAGARFALALWFRRVEDG